MNTDECEVGYPTLHENGELLRRAKIAWEIMHDCVLCPQECHVNRRAGQRGFCRSGDHPIISSYGPHYGEEEPLVGRRGSGTIFFTNCNMRCIFCQNYEISQCSVGYEISCADLAKIMLRLQKGGCHNINFVSPSHFVSPIIRAIDIAASKGLRIPLVYNSGGYDSVETITFLQGIFDIYMPDAKYGRNEAAWELSHARNYVEYNHAVLKEMHRQVGDLLIRDGLAVRGMIIRHLVLPHHLADSERVFQFIAEEISKDAYVNIMAQYHYNRLIQYDKNEETPLLKLIQRPITTEEYVYAIRCAREVGLHRGFD
ncbi:MAG: radical SAM protein [Methanomicrobiales archaeon]|nr:radical SAM protein [Methanomicrobiales archaeon]